MSVDRPFLGLIFSMISFGFFAAIDGCKFGSAFANGFVRTVYSLAKFECQKEVGEENFGDFFNKFF